MGIFLALRNSLHPTFLGRAKGASICNQKGFGYRGSAETPPFTPNLMTIFHGNAFVVFSCAFYWL